MIMDNGQSQMSQKIGQLVNSEKKKKELTHFSQAHQ